MLVEAFPEEAVGGVFAGEDAAFAVFDGGEEEAIRALEVEPADVVGGLATGDEIVFEVVGDGAGFGVDGEGAEIGGVGFKGGGFFFGCGGDDSFCIGSEGFAIGFEDDVDAHMAAGVVHDEAGGVVIDEGAARGIAFDGDQTPGADKLFGEVVGWWSGRGGG